MKTKKANKEAKKVWRALLSHAQDRRQGLVIERRGFGTNFCRDCETWNARYSYAGRKWTLLVSDCYSCGRTTKETRGSQTKLEPASQKRGWLYGNRAETVRIETESLFAGTR